MSTVGERNTDLFKQHIAKIDFYMEENYNQNGSFFAINEKTNNGANIRIVASFSNEYPSVDVYCFNLAEITNPLKREIALKHMNELNTNYRFSKFILNDEGSVAIQSSLDFTDDNFNPELVVKHVMMLYHAANDEYQNFMKIAWA